MKDRDNDGLLEHSTNLQHMWLSEEDQTTGWLEFDLGQIHKLDLIQVWNLNEKWLTKRGVKRADISVWTEKAGWKKVLDDFEFGEAEGKNDYDEPVLVKLDGIEAQKVRLDDLVNLGDTEHIGLSEVQFFEETPGTIDTNEVPTIGEIEPGKRSNWIPVLVIVIIAVVAAGLATLRKKAT